MREIFFFRFLCKRDKRELGAGRVMPVELERKKEGGV